MNQNIVNSLGLKPTKEHFGQTFVNNVTIYSYDNKVFLAGCNLLGEPTEGKTIVYSFAKGVKYFYVYDELLEADGEAILKNAMEKWT